MNAALSAVELATATAGLGGAAAWSLHRPTARLVWRELRFPDELEAEPVEALLCHIASIRQGPVVVVVASTRGAVWFRIGATESAMTSIVAAAAGLLPEVRFDEVDNEPASAESDCTRVAAVNFAARVDWAGAWPLLRTGASELTVAALLGSLASVGDDEQLQLCLRLWPAGRVRRPVPSSERASAAPPPAFVRLFWPPEPPREDVRLIRTKFGGLLLRTEIVVAAGSPGAARDAQLSQRVLAVLRSASGSRGQLRWRPLRGHRRAQDALDRMRAPLPWEASTLLAPSELVGLLGLPIAAPRVAGVSYGAGPRLMPALGLPSSGRVFAGSTWPGAVGRPLAQPILGGLQHTAIVGPTGTGKSALIAELVLQDMTAGRGTLVVDLKGDLVSDLLQRVPPNRRRDVVVLEPARGGAQPGLQLFPAGGDPELTADLLLGTLREIFSQSWGVRSSQYLGLGLRTLAGLPGATLLELPLLFSDRRLRARALAGGQDRWLVAAWQRFDSLSAADQAVQLTSPLNKIEELIGRRRLRMVLGQRESRLRFDEVLRHRRIVLVSLPPGLLGMPATRLLAALTLWQFFQAVEARAALPASERSPFMAYIDEIAVLTSLPLPLEGLLERARGHGVGLTLAPQALSQLTPAVRASLLANVGSLVAFRQNALEEATVLARALPGVTPAQLQHLGRYEIALRLSLGPGNVTSTMTGQTIAPRAVGGDADALRRDANERYGQTMAVVDADALRRAGLAPDPPSGTTAAPSATAGEPRLGWSRRPS